MQRFSGHALMGLGWRRVASAVWRADVLACGPWPRRSLASAAPTAGTHPLLNRYLQLTKGPLLQFEERQWVVLQRLARLYDELRDYSGAVGAFNEQHQRWTAAFQARVAERLAASAQQGTTAASTRSGTQQQLSAKQAERLQRLAVEKAVVEELGPAPVPPTQPRGLYLHGSVGSGKSMLMDLFFGELRRAEWAQSAEVGTYLRRLHFNAALHEMHQRLHKLDVEHRAAQQQLSASPPGLPSADGIAHAGKEEDEEEEDEGEEEEEEEQQASTSAARDDGAKPSALRTLWRFFDEGVRQQKAARRAVLSIRRHLRLAQQGRVPRHALARANSQFVQRAAASFIHSKTGGLHEGWNHPAARRGVAVVCFDEMQVSDPFSAVALKGLTEGLVQQGGTLVRPGKVCTSNRAPHELPRHGLHEALFGNFIDTIKQHADVVELSSPVDHRSLLLSRGAAHVDVAPGGGKLRSLYVHPLGPDADQAVEELWRHVTAGRPAAPQHVQVGLNRTIPVPLAAGRAARFDFRDLCAVPLGPADYMVLCRHFDTILLTSVPVMSMQVRDQARRFITFLDEVINSRTRLLVSAAAPADQLFSAGDGQEQPILDLEQLQFEGAVAGSKMRRNLLADGGVAPVASTPQAAAQAIALLGGQEEQFAFRRAVSRLLEVQSSQYVDAWARLRAQAA